MALFSRRPKPSDDGPAEPTDAGDPGDSEVAGGRDSEAETVVDGAVPDVGISVSSFGGLGAGPTAAAATAAMPEAAAATPAEAPVAETVGGIPENALLRRAVDAFAQHPEPSRLIDVARQLLQGSVYLRVKGDVRELLASGREVPFAVATRDDKQYAVVFSGGRALQAAARADGASDTSALGQPVQAVLRHVMTGTYAGVVIDSWAGRTSPVLPRTLIEAALKDADPDATLKTLLAGPRTPAVTAQIVAALADVRVWIAVNRAEGSSDLGVSESRASDGTRHLSVFSHPLEVAALGRTDRPVPVTTASLARALSSDPGLAGLLIDPAGPWLRLSRDDLAPLLRFASS